MLAVSNFVAPAVTQSVNHVFESLFWHFISAFESCPYNVSSEQLEFYTMPNRYAKT